MCLQTSNIPTEAHAVTSPPSHTKPGRRKELVLFDISIDVGGSGGAILLHYTRKVVSCTHLSADQHY